MKTIDTIVVGAGQAGLAMSFHLRQQGREHLVLDRGRVAERWRTQRWDSLMFQSPNWSIELPGAAYAGDDPDGFLHKDEVLRFIESYCVRIEAPVVTSTAVSSLRHKGHDGTFELVTDQGVFYARNVVVATGPYQRPRHSTLESALPGELLQLHASEYRNPAQLPSGAVVVVGTGASGCQIADELLESGRRTFLSVGRHCRVPRRYRGHDIFWWRRILGILDRTAEQTPPTLRSPGPLLTGAHGGYEVDPRRSAGRGMKLLGRLLGIAEATLSLADDLESNLRQGDQARKAFLAEVDAYVMRTGLDVPLPLTDEPDGESRTMVSPDRLDLRVEGITSIIWATGYEFEFDWIDLPVFDHCGAPLQHWGATSVPGLYFLGLPWMHSAKSSFLYGVGEDAAHIASIIAGDGATRARERCTQNLPRSLHSGLDRRLGLN